MMEFLQKGLDQRLKNVMEYLLRKNPYEYKTQKQVAQFIDFPQSNLSAALKGNQKYLTETIVNKFLSKFPELNEDWLKGGKGEMTSQTQIIKEPTPHTPTPQKFSEKLFKKEVIVIPAKAQLGLQSYLYPEEMINELETKTISVDQDYKGRYYEIECVGDSMDAENRNAIRNGDTVLCREISKMHWQNNFHKNDWEFVFFHNEFGIIIKCIKEQNLETGDLLLCSYNPNKNEYPDFTINIKDCYAICNVVQVSQNRKKYYTL